MASAGKELILGVTGSIAAYKAVYLLRELTRQGARVTVVDHGPRRAVRRPPHLADAVRAARAVGPLRPADAEAVEHVGARRARPRLRGRAGHRQSPRQGRPRHRRRLPHHAAARRALPRADGARHGRRHVGPSRRRRQRRARSASAASPCSSPTRARSPPGSRARAGCPRSTPSSRRSSGCSRPCATCAGERVLVTSGPTREPIDPVRYLSNRSSGKMGHAVATACAAARRARSS